MHISQPAGPRHHPLHPSAPVLDAHLQLHDGERRDEDLRDGYLQNDRNEPRARRTAAAVPIDVLCAAFPPVRPHSCTGIRISMCTYGCLSISTCTLHVVTIS